jgi:UDP-GlcNAc:undecaprenyl-phosphate GlcNAc-1-phosphate transferase
VLGLLKGDLFGATIGFTITGSLLGFLMFNFPPASVFLGDGGSMMLGFLLGTLATSSAAISPGQRFGTAFMILVPFLPFGIPLFEVALSVLRRWIRGQAIFLGDGNHLHHRLTDKIKNPRLTIAVFYFFSAALCVLTVVLEMEVSSMALRFMAGAAAVVLLAGAVASLRLYRVDRLLATIQNRRHFKFLGTFLPYVKNRLMRARSLHELIEILQIGVRDLGFDYVEVAHEGEVVEKWVNPRPVHPESSRIVSEEKFYEDDLSIRWARPVHDDDTYNEYLMLTWYRFMVAFRAEMANHAWELRRQGRNNVVELARKTPPD